MKISFNQHLKTLIEKHYSKNEFCLKDIYGHVEYFKKLYPNNNNLNAKIRQQLQILRDKQIIEFLGNGLYKLKV